MILITGGFGSIGAHTARALAAAGHDVLVVGRHRPDTVPEILRSDRIIAAVADTTDLIALRALGDRYEITDVVHLAAALPSAADTGDFWYGYLNGLLNVITAAKAWEVRRVAVASSIGVYLGREPGPWSEDQALPLFPDHPIAASKQAAELIITDTARDADFQPVLLRIGSIWGPLGWPDSPFLAVQRMINAAARGEDADLRPPRPVERAGDGGDRCYVDDCGRAIALIITADRLNHTAYNVSSGRPATNQDFIDALDELVPGHRSNLPPGRSPDRGPTDPYLRIDRLVADTGFAPIWDVRSGVADYLDWLSVHNS